MKIIDPTFVFILGCLCLPLAIEESLEEQINYLKEPVLYFAFGLILITLYLTHKVGKTANITLLDKHIATWYILNGAIIHILMDGLVGGFHKLKLMDKNYKILDKRFIEDEPCIHLVSLIELFVMGPACLMLYRAYHKRKPYKNELEIFVCTLQIAGTLFFAFTELLRGQPNLPVDWNLEFTFHHIVYYWFGFVLCEPIWILVPGILGIRAFTKNVATKMKYYKEKKN